MAFGDPLSLPNPDVGTAGTGYASQVKALLAEIASRVSTPLPIGSIAAGVAGSEQLDLNDVPLLNAQYVQFYEQAGSPSGSPFGRLVRYAGNLYYVDSAGACQLTDGASINAASVAGIGGDYGGANPAALNFVDASETYEFYDNAALTQWAIVKARQLNLVDEASGFVASVLPSAGISADYSLVLPDALPASGVSALAVDSSGNVVLADQSGPVSNQFSVTGGVKHDDQTQWFPATHFTVITLSGSPTGTTGAYVSGTAVYSVAFLVPAPPVGRRLKTASARVYMATTNTTLCTVQIQTATDLTYADIGTPGTSNTNGGAYSTASATSTDTAVAGVYYRVKVTFTTTGVVTEDRIVALGLTYDYV